jgi:hypothetical protein
VEIEAVGGPTVYETTIFEEKFVSIPPEALVTDPSR